MPRLRPAAPILLLALAGCAGEPPPPPPAEAAPAPVVVQEDVIDWRACRFEGLAVPVPGKLFVVDAGAPLDDAEPGRETIRRVDVLVPGPVALMLTAPDATAWLVRPGPATEVVAIFASGPAPQRITGQGLGPHRLERSTAFGQACGRHWLPGEPGPELAQAVEEIFGRPYDAAYRMRIGSVIIGGAERAPELLGD